MQFWHNAVDSPRSIVCCSCVCVFLFNGIYVLYHGLYIILGDSSKNDHRQSQASREKKRVKLSAPISRSFR